MPYDRPTLTRLRDRIGGLYRTRFPGADTNMRQSPDRAVVEVIAASTDEDLSYLDWQVRQLFPFSADVDYLERWAAAKGLARKPATAGAGMVTLTGEPTRVAPADTELRTADGLAVRLTAEATIGGGGTVDAAAAALVGGKTGNLGIGVGLTFVGTPVGFADAGVVATAFAGGADAESDASLRLRTLTAFAEPSFGGNQDDWENAALRVAGVTRVFSAAATPTPGSVTLWPLFDDLRENGIPVGTDARYRPEEGASGTGDQRLVLDGLLAGGVGQVKPPICASVYVKALVETPIDIEIDDLVGDSAALRAAIALELGRMLLRRAAPARTISRSWITEAISRAAGEDSHTLVSPAGDSAITAGHIAVLGDIDWP